MFFILVKNIRTHLRSRIKEGSYLYDIILCVMGNVETEEVTLGTIVTQTNQVGKINLRYAISDIICKNFGINTEEALKQCLDAAEKETMSLNEFFATDF